MKYYVYQLLNPTTLVPFYVGKGTKDRFSSHSKFKDGNNNPYKDRVIRKLQEEKTEPVVDIVKFFDNEDDAYAYEEDLIESIGLDNLTNITKNARPPCKKGWKPSPETLLKRSEGLKGIPRTEKWKENLSKAKQGNKNPMFGKVEDPKHKEKRILSSIRSKNLPNYDLYKEAINLMNNGISADVVSKELGIGRGVCFRLKNRSHKFFLAFPELI